MAWLPRRRLAPALKLAREILLFARAHKVWWIVPLLLLLLLASIVVVGSQTALPFLYP